MNYYNENDLHAAAWLRELIKAKLISDGIVDDRSITDVQPADLCGFKQCHFFAGIGGWSYALRLAGCRDDEPVWTGSCPCQPFSVAGKGRAELDSRHLWPQFCRLISQCKPAMVFGEQVAGAAGRIWLSGVRADLEALDYEVGAADLCALSVGAKHQRQRLYFVANAKGSRLPWRMSPGTNKAHEVKKPKRVGLAKFFENIVPTYNWQGEPCMGEGIHAVPGRMALLRGYGNAIVPQVAAAFIQAAIEAIAA